MCKREFKFICKQCGGLGFRHYDERYNVCFLCRVRNEEKLRTVASTQDTNQPESLWAVCHPRGVAFNDDKRAFAYKGRDEAVMSQYMFAMRDGYIVREFTMVPANDYKRLAAIENAAAKVAAKCECFGQYDDNEVCHCPVCETKQAILPSNPA